MKSALIIKNLYVETKEGKKILNGVSLTVKRGEIHAIMGPNGSGKSTLSQALMGHPGYLITAGSVSVDGIDITNLSPDKRAKAGLFLGFQYPVEVPGVHFGNFLRMAINDNLPENSKKISPIAFKNQFASEARTLAFSDDIIKRSLNEGFSGGEKKKAEILQLSLLKSPYVILDEPDSGLDVDALKYIAKKINSLAYEPGMILITHYQRILEFIKPDFVHILVNGKIAASGVAELARNVEKFGYEEYQLK